MTGAGPVRPFPVDVPAEIGTALPLPSGEILLVPAELNGAIAAAIATAYDAPDEARFRTAFGEALVRGLHDRGLILVARARQQTREAVNADIYSLALGWKHEAERRLAEAMRLVGPLPDLGSLAHHLQSAVDALTGHAPPAQAQVLVAALDERVRAMRLLLLGIALDEPLKDPPPVSLKPAPSPLTPGDAA